MLSKRERVTLFPKALRKILRVLCVIFLGVQHEEKIGDALMDRKILDLQIESLQVSARRDPWRRRKEAHASLGQPDDLAFQMKGVIILSKNHHPFAERIRGPTICPARFEHGERLEDVPPNEPLSSQQPRQAISATTDSTGTVNHQVEREKLIELGRIESHVDGRGCIQFALGAPDCQATKNSS
jgi:hypothetical protein